MDKLKRNAVTQNKNNILFSLYAICVKRLVTGKLAYTQYANYIQH